MAGRYCSILCLCSLILFILNDSVLGQMTEEYTGLEMDCPEENTPMMATDIPWGVPGRAYKTLPRGLVIAPSKIPGAGFGVLSETFIPKYTWLGLFDGEIVPVKYEDHISLYAWEVKRDWEITAYIDGFHFHLSSYHRYMNAPTRHRDENVISAECYGRIYYVTNKDILPGDELLIYYGPNYTLEILGIDFNLYFEVPKAFQDGGLDLNNVKHRRSVEREGFELYEVKYLQTSWLSKFLRRKEQKKCNSSGSDMVGG